MLDENITTLYSKLRQFLLYMHVLHTAMLISMHACIWSLRLSANYSTNQHYLQLVWRGHTEFLHGHLQNGGIRSGHVKL
jgi:hypothetical protein